MGATFWEHRMNQNAKMAKIDTERSHLKVNHEEGSDSSSFPTDIRNTFPMNVKLERTDVVLPNINCKRKYREMLSKTKYEEIVTRIIAPCIEGE